jgi:hypothetical protein
VLRQSNSIGYSRCSNLDKYRNATIHTLDHSLNDQLAFLDSHKRTFASRATEVETMDAPG